MEEFVHVKYLVDSASTSNAIIKNQASNIYEEGMYPAYSASGQDVWLYNYIYDKSAIIISAVGARCGKTFLATGKWGVCANTHILFSKEEKCNIEYLNYILNDEEWWIKGGSAQPFVKVDASLNQKIYLPTLKEQKLIVSFLNEEMKEINDILKDLNRQIEILDKYKITLITEQFDKNTITKVKYIGNFQNGMNFDFSMSDKTIKFLGVGDFRNNFILSSERDFSEISIEEKINQNELLQSGDIIFVRSNGSKELVGRSVMVDNINYPLTYSGFCIRLRNYRKDILNKYLLYFFRSNLFRQELNRGSMGTNITNLSQSVLGDIVVPICSVERQKEIINFLDNKCSEIDEIIANKKNQIEKMEKYKKSLIYEYVTGKKRVKGAEELYG